MATVLIVGGQGVLGSILADTIRQRTSHRVLIGGRRPQSGEDFRLIDTNQPETIRAALDDVEVVITTVADPLFEIESAVVQRGLVSLNISSAVLPLGGHAKVFGRGLALVHVGLAPLGLQALIAKDLLRRFPAAARLEVAMAFSASAAGGRQGREFAFEALTRTPFEPSRTIPFLAPVGTRRCFSAALPDRDILGSLAAELSAGVYIGFSERVVHYTLAGLRATGLIRLVPRSLFVGRQSHASAPVKATQEPTRQWAAIYDRDENRLAAAITEGEGDYLTTALVTLAFLEAFEQKLRPRKLRGVFSAERVLSLDDVRPYIPPEVRIREVS